MDAGRAPASAGETDGQQKSAVAGKDGILEIDPETMRLFGGQGSMDFSSNLSMRGKTANEMKAVRVSGGESIMVIRRRSLGDHDRTNVETFQYDRR